ncbi:MAG: class II aldolase/adducin family protein [Burkholderiales bacterium]|nr:class II aldolase/adducin family protein [Burkholderiales bacterium]HMM52438.1 class II aldolase/adducin family protein [Burkholderiaceae bacterium]
MNTNATWPSENAARAAIVDAARRMNALGINTGRAGNVSMRWHRGGADGLLITPSALAYEAMTIDDLVWLAVDAPAGEDTAAGQPSFADGARQPSSEWRLHRDLYAVRGDAGAIVHAHPPFATTLACLPRIHAEGIPAFHYMIAVAGGNDIRCAPYATFGTVELSAAARTALDGRRACLLAQHGLVALSGTLESALELAVEVESLARIYWQALQLGEPALLDATAMASVHARFSRYRPDREEPVLGAG